MSRRIWTKPFIKYNLSGDRTIAKSLERKARACVGYLFDQLMPNQKFRSQNWNLADGSRITAYVWRDVLGERARVEIYSPTQYNEVTGFVPYLIESGAYVLSNVLSTPSVLFYIGDSISGQYRPLVDFNKDSSLDSLDTVCPIGIVNYPETSPGVLALPEPLVGDINPLTYTAASSRVPVDKVVVKWLCPASLYTGKLRLYVQSVYGNSKFTKLSANISMSGTGTLLVNGLSVSHSGTSGTTLITGRDYTYYLCNIIMSGSVCTIQTVKMTPVAGYEDIAELYRNKLLSDYPGQENTKSGATSQKHIIEAMLLAHLEPNTDYLYTTTCAVPAWASEYGSPLEYSWKTTWDGKEASIVLVFGDAASQAASTQRLKLILSEGEEGIFSASMVSMSLDKISVGMQWFVWTPESMLSGSSLLSHIFYPCTSSEDPIITSPVSEYADVPIYGWYDDTNTWVSVSISFEKSVSLGEGSNIGQLMICGFGSVSGTGVYGDDEKWSSYIVSCNGKSITAHALSGRRSARFATSTVSPGVTWSNIGYWENHSYGEQCGGSLCTSIDPYACGTYQLRYFEFQTGIGSSDSVTLDLYTCFGKASVIIPSRDCEAAVIGTFKTVNSGQFRSYTVSGVSMLHPSVYLRVSEVLYDSGLGAYVEGEKIWSGSNSRSQITTFGGVFSGGSSTIISDDETSKQITIIACLKASTETVMNMVTGSGGLGSYNYNPVDPDMLIPGVAPNSEYYSDWEAFFEAPWGVCSSGVRDLSLLPTLTQSAIFESVSGYGRNGLPFDITSDGYQSVDTFVGWA